MKRREKKVTNNNNEPWYRNGKETKDKRQGFQTNKPTSRPSKPSNNNKEKKTHYH